MKDEEDKKEKKEAPVEQENLILNNPSRVLLQ